MGNQPSQDTELTPIGNSNQFEYELDFSPPYNDQVCFFWTCKNDDWSAILKHSHQYNRQVKYMDVIDELDIYAEQNTTVSLCRNDEVICSWDVEVGDTTVPIFTGSETDFPFIFCTGWQIITIRSNHPVDVTVRGRMLTEQQISKLFNTTIERADTNGRMLRFYKGLGMGYPRE